MICRSLGFRARVCCVSVYSYRSCCCKSLSRVSVNSPSAVARVPCFFVSVLSVFAFLGLLVTRGGGTLIFSFLSFFSRMPGLSAYSCPRTRFVPSRSHLIPLGHNEVIANHARVLDRLSALLASFRRGRVWQGTRTVPATVPAYSHRLALMCLGVFSFFFLVL